MKTKEQLYQERDKTKGKLICNEQSNIFHAYGECTKQVLYRLLDYIDDMKTRGWFFTKHERIDLENGNIRIDYILKIASLIEQINESKEQHPADNSLHMRGEWVPEHDDDDPQSVQLEEKEKEKYPVIAIDDIDEEVVKRWFQLLMGYSDDSIMIADIKATARASFLNRHLNWESPSEQPVTDEDIEKEVKRHASKDSFEDVIEDDMIKGMMNTIADTGFKVGAKWMRNRITNK